MIAFMPSVHQPVMLREVLQGLALAAGLSVVDGTVGGGGHSREILKRIQPGGRLLGLDRDPLMLGFAAEKLGSEHVTLRQASYLELPNLLTELGWPPVDRILVDLGLSSDQLADANRGFSFQATGELDMRFDTQRGRSAAELLGSASAEELEQIFLTFGEEPQSRRIAEYVVQQRSNQPIISGRQLADAVLEATKQRYSGRETHPATRVFQALRIAVNEELQHVEQALTTAFPRSLTAGGILAVITFHSLEDRIVKQALKDSTAWEPLTHKPISPTPNEVRFNPRSRSAKLRLARRKPDTVQATSSLGKDPER